jgi:hypothetical protein
VPKRGSRGITLPVREPRHEEGMGWLAPRPGRFTPGKETRYVGFLLRQTVNDKSLLSNSLLAEP